MKREIKLPLTAAALKEMKTGDEVCLSGILYTARDAAHQRLLEALEEGKPLPFDLQGETVYYMGPTPAKPGYPIGSAGPTTSGRMDRFTPRLLAAGLRGMSGKGKRSAAVKEAMREHRAVYLAALGGAGALISRSIKKAEVIAYGDLGAEAVLRLEVEDFPAIVINDIYGGDLYDEGRARYRVDV